MIRATFTLYREALSETGRAIVRGPAAWVGSLLIPPITMVVGMLVAPLGLIGGFVLGFVSIGLFGAYLYLVAQSLERQGPLGFGILRESLGEHLWDVMGVAFIHWVIMSLLGMASLPGQVTLVVSIVGIILFNPWPEVIHQDRISGTTEILVRSFRFMSSNGPEWVFAHLGLVALGWWLMTAGPTQWMMAGGLASGVLLHPVMVFRGALYRALGKGSRRTRAWKSRF